MLSGLAVCLSVNELRAERAQLALSYRAPDACPRIENVRSEIDRLLGGEAATSSAIVSADARIERAHDSYRLDLSWSTGASGDVRTLNATTCEELTRALALIIALAMDPENPALGGAMRGEDSPPPSESNGRNETPAPLAPPKAPTHFVTPLAPEQTAHRAEERASSVIAVLRNELAARGGILFDVGSLPSASAGGFVGVDVPLRPFSLAVDLEALWPQEKLVAERGGRFWMFALAAQPCRPFLVSRIELSPCLAAEVVVLPSSGRRVAVPENASTWFGRFGAGFEVSYPADSRVKLRVGSAGLLAPFRPSFLLRDETVVHRPELVSWRAALGVAAAL